MNVFLESVGTIAPWHDQLSVLKRCAVNDSRDRHGVVGSRNDADIIITVLHANPFLTRLSSDKRRFVYSSHDIGFPFFPGIYPSLRCWNEHPNYCRSGPYLPKTLDFVNEDLAAHEPRRLYSFVGSVLTSPLRQEVLRLRHPDGLVRDTSQHDAYRSKQPAETYQRFQRDYLATLADSLFVLCPRGVGVSSVRLFEAMRAGRVPVVISDHWSPPLGIPWDDFIVRVAEGNIASIPDRLEHLADQARMMGECARTHYAHNFAEDTVFDWLVEQCAAMLGCANKRALTFSAWMVWRLFSPRNLRSVGAPWLRARIRRHP